ncbi:MAG: tripartite tricarboxylate transporter substrate-binding protein [Dehalococcoidia bacterium]|nr:tripartite tricarboxylate transporter substrate-binding protein [Dehalococcoidia bacterium]MDZ4246900.1 tripartite tricarboxylate transporter substrate-binding protein [Dehalococcoidia bacterium]
MKVNKYFLAIFSVILILGLLASACGPKAEPTQAPAPTIARRAPTAAATAQPPAPARPTAAPTRPPVAAPTAAPAPTQSPMDKAAAFYKGKAFQIVIPYNPGGGYDTWGRILAPYLGKHLGATAIVKNEPGAGAKIALNRLAKLKDGLSIILFSPRAALTSQIYADEGVAYDLGQFNWIGTVSADVFPVVVSTKTGWKTLADLQAAPEVKFGSDTKTSGKAIRPLVMGSILGVNVKLVTGYGGSADEMLAMQRGEVDGLSTNVETLKPFIDSGDIVPVLMMHSKRIQYWPDVPTIYEAKQLTPEEKNTVDVALAFEAGRVAATTPNVPAERVAFLEAALKKTLAEPEVISKIKKIGAEVEFTSAKETSEKIKVLLAMNPKDKTMFGKLLGIKGY